MILKNKTDKKAFTFIELLIVVIIIGILTGVSIPQLKKTVNNFELESFVKDTYYLCRFLQDSAISHTEIYCLNIDRDEGRLWATYKREDEFENIEGRFGKIYRVPQGATVFAEKQTIYFYPDGSIDEVIISFENTYKNKVSLVIQGASGDIKIQ